MSLELENAAENPAGVAAAIMHAINAGRDAGAEVATVATMSSEGRLRVWHLLQDAMPERTARVLIDASDESAKNDAEDGKEEGAAHV